MELDGGLVHGDLRHAHLVEFLHEPGVLLDNLMSERVDVVHLRVQRVDVSLVLALCDVVLGVESVGSQAASASRAQNVRSFALFHFSSQLLRRTSREIPQLDASETSGFHVWQVVVEGGGDHLVLLAPADVDV